MPWGFPTVVRTDRALAEFQRLHQTFTFHLGVATVLAWATALYAAMHAPWVRNLAFLIDPTTYRVESTWVYLFSFPIMLAVSWVMCFAGRDMLFHMRLFRRNQVAEFASAGAVAFMMFYFAIDRAVAALSLAWM